MALTSLTLNLIFEIISRLKWFFHMETPTFDSRFGKSGKFYVQNHIENFSKVISRSNLGQTQRSPFKIVFFHEPQAKLVQIDRRLNRGTQNLHILVNKTQTRTS